MIMDNLDTMLGDTPNLTTLLNLESKYTKFRELQKQMSNISTPSPATTPEPVVENIAPKRNYLQMPISVATEFRFVPGSSTNEPNNSSSLAMPLNQSGKICNLILKNIE